MPSTLAIILAIILAKMPSVLSTLRYTSNHPSYYCNFCYQNAFVNKNFAFKHLNLRQVAGSVAFNGWWEYGGPKYDFAKFKQNPRDSHSWLEDDEGNIYDYIYEWNRQCAVINTGSYGKMRVGELRKVSLADAASMGLTYKKADPKSMKLLLDDGCRTISSVRVSDAPTRLRQGGEAFKEEVGMCDPVCV